MRVRRGFTSIAGAFALLGQALPSAAQLSHTNVSTQTSLSVACAEPECDCFVDGSPSACPAADLQRFDSGNLADPTSQVHTPMILGQFAGLDARSSFEANVTGSAHFGVLRAFSSSSALAAGADVLAGGVAIGGTVGATTSTSFEDRLTILGPAGLRVALVLTQVVFATTLTSVEGEPGIDPCLANASADVLLHASLVASGPRAGASGSAQFTRHGRVGAAGGGCLALGDTGSPFGVVVLDLQVGDQITIAHSLDVTSAVQLDGGLGSPTNPERALAVSTLIDAYNTARLYIDVPTPGASYASASTTIYPSPEPEFGVAVAGGILGLAWAARQRLGTSAREQRRAQADR